MAQGERWVWERGSWHKRRPPWRSGQLLITLGLVLISIGFIVGVIAAETVTYSPASVPVSQTYNSTLTAITPVSTSSLTTRITTYSSSVYGSGIPSCPYGGTYYSSICTSLCGCQYNVCVTFDYNCANDYRAIPAYITRTNTIRTVTTMHNTVCMRLTEHLTGTQTSTMYTTFTEYGNPALSGMSYSVVMIGAVIMLSGAILDMKRKPGS